MGGAGRDYTEPLLGAPWGPPGLLGTTAAITSQGLSSSEQRLSCCCCCCCCVNVPIALLIFMPVLTSPHTWNSQSFSIHSSLALLHQSAESPEVTADGILFFFSILVNSATCTIWAEVPPEHVHTGRHRPRLGWLCAVTPSSDNKKHSNFHISFFFFNFLQFF